MSHSPHNLSRISSHEPLPVSPHSKLLATVLFRLQPLSTKSSYLPSCTIHTDQTLSSIWRSLRLCLFAVYELKSSSVCISSMPMVCTNAKGSIHECTDRRITFTKFSLLPSYSNSTKHLPICSPTATSLCHH
jgi:hypothetical protein